MVNVPRQYRKLFQDSIIVSIPLNVTADLGIAVKRTREKRIRAFQEHFPSLKKTEKKAKNDDTNKMDLSDQGSDEEEDDKKDDPSSKKKNKGNQHMPNREAYGSVIDYLEAKYVQGVMLQDEDEEGESDGEDGEADDKRSVYDSESSFLDDSLLRRDVAEQVLSQSTQTKLQLENDDEFFVNVGNLEVEDNDLMDYDPLQDEQAKKPAAKRKRAKSTDTKKEASKKAKPAAKTNAGKAASSKKAKTSKADSKEDDKKTEKGKGEAANSDVSLSELKQNAADKKKKSDELFKATVKMIKKLTNEQLPLKTRMVKLSILVPQGKAAGDKIMFTNPHSPDQRLTVKVPANKKPGSKFMVHVPVPSPSDLTDNKFPREFNDLVSDFASMYDDWCTAEAKYHEAAPDRKGKFKLRQTQLAKYDDLIDVFKEMGDLVQPIDAEYMRKLVRRAKQNKNKRKKTAQSATSKEEDKKEEAKPSSSPKAPPKPAAAKKPAAQKEEVKDDSEPETITLKIPGKGTTFAKVAVHVSEFDH